MAVLVWLPLAHGAWADDAPPTTQSDTGLTIGAADPATDAKPAEVAKWFNQLDAADATVRDTAYNKLLSLKASHLSMLKEAVKASLPLRPGQASALPEIVKQVYCSGMDYPGDPSSGFLGVSLVDRDLTQDPNPPPGVRHVGLLVSNCLPGFCGARALRPGDVILAINERPDVKIEGYEIFADTVKSFPAGQTIHLNVLRQGQVIRVAVTLDPRPSGLDGANPPGVVQDLESSRKDAADDYWSRSFAPLFKGGTS
jgi:PDZ domain